MTARNAEKDSQMKSKMTSAPQTQWATPLLTYKGTVGQILQGGGGKLSIAGSDPGEGRCEKPHEADCRAASAR
jgi:hypothetical protein